MKLILLPHKANWAKILNEVLDIPVIDVPFSDVINTKEDNDTILIPTNTKHVLLVSEHQEILRNLGYIFMTCAYQTIFNLDDKKALSNHALKKYLPCHYDISSLTYPCILKERNNCYGKHVYILKNKNDLETRLYYISNNNDYIFQEAIYSNREYSTQFLVNNGNIIMHSTYCKLTQNDLYVWPYVEAKYEQITLDQEYLDIFNLFFVNYNGFINADYKIVDKKIFILEFNARLSGVIFRITSKEVLDFIHEYIRISKLI